MELRRVDRELGSARAAPRCRIVHASDAVRVAALHTRVILVVFGTNRLFALCAFSMCSAVGD